MVESTLVTEVISEKRTFKPRIQKPADRVS
jgi:hypothetical protein